MSGGSYNYLCTKDAGDLVGYQGEGDLVHMAERLAGLGYAEDAAKDAYDLLAMVRTQRARIDAALKRLYEVFYAVEWWDSADRSEDDVKEALAKYRGEPS